MLDRETIPPRLLDLGIGLSRKGFLLPAALAIRQDPLLLYLPTCQIQPWQATLALNIVLNSVVKQEYSL